MNKKFSIFFGVIIVVVATFFVALPKYYSAQNDKFVVTFLKKLEKSSNGVLSGKLINSTSSWFSSKNVIAFKYKFNPLHFKDTKGMFERSGTFNISLSSHYGPIMFVNGHIKFGQGYMTYVANTNSQTAKLFTSPLLTGSTFIHFLGNSDSQFQGFRIANKKGVTFNGVSVNIFVNGKMNKVKGTTKIGSLTATNKNDSIQLDESTQTFQLESPNKDNLWFGERKLTVPLVNIKSKNMVATFQKITIGSKTINNSNKSFDRLINVKIPSFNINNNNGSYQLNFQLQNINTAAVVNLQHLATQAAQKNFEIQEQQAKELLLQIGKKLPGYLVPKLVREEAEAGAKSLIV